MTGGALGCSIGAVYSVHHLRNYLTAESLVERYKKRLHRQQAKKERESRQKILTRVRHSVVIHVRVRPGPEFDFGWPGPARREDRRCSGKRRGSGKGGRQTLPLVFEGTELSV